jgi:hypothetical protein
MTPAPVQPRVRRRSHRHRSCYDPFASSRGRSSSGPGASKTPIHSRIRASAIRNVPSGRSALRRASRSINSCSDASVKCNSLRAPSCAARARYASRSLRVQNPYSRITSTPSSSARAARSRSACSTGSRAASSASPEMSAPKSRAIHSSGHKRSAGSSRSSVLASVVFPEHGSPQMRCSVAMILLLRIPVRSVRPPNVQVHRAGANSLKDRRSKYDAKHGPAARVQRFVRRGTVTTSLTPRKFVRSIIMGNCQRAATSCEHVVRRVVEQASHRTNAAPESTAP